MEEIDRRTLLRRAGLLAGTGALAGLAGCEPDRGTAPAAGDGSAAPPSGWAAVRAQFDLDPGKRHFAAFVLASHPRPVAEAVERHRRGLQADPDGYYESHNRRLETAARVAAAGYLGGEADEVALTRSTTDGLGLLYGGLRLRPGQEAVTTAHDFYATHEALRLRAERTGVTVRRITLYRDPARVTADRLVAAVHRGIGPRTRVLALTWVHSGTGVKLPLAEIGAVVGEMNRDRDPVDRVLVCVDAVHALGVEPADVAGLGCDFLVAGCHKWLFGPRGTGLVWGRREAWDEVTGTIPSFDRRAIGAWISGRDPDGPRAAMFSPGGFHAFEHRWALAEAFAFHLQLGERQVAERTRLLAARLKDGLAAIPAVRLVTPRTPELSAGIVCLDVGDLDPDQAVAGLRRQGILASVTPYATPHLRLGPSIVTSETDVDAAVRAVRALA
ncbi:MAG TPA: aminotransferase class V-fold PLP-dependent enzyme [Actinomycetes bacterium]|nr:aminotransferase class V-fold PLP-dependent enzyme [Actinomycetes bacterium]